MELSQFAHYFSPISVTGIVFLMFGLGHTVIPRGGSEESKSKSWLYFQQGSTVSYLLVSAGQLANHHSLSDDGRSIFLNVANINKLVRDKIKLFFQNILQHDLY